MIFLENFQKNLYLKIVFILILKNLSKFIFYFSVIVISFLSIEHIFWKHYQNVLKFKKKLSKYGKAFQNSFNIFLFFDLHELSTTLNFLILNLKSSAWTPKLIQNWIKKFSVWFSKFIFKAKKKAKKLNTKFMKCLREKKLSCLQN